MKETTFLIKCLDNGWDWLDIYSEEEAAIYCCEELEVPEELINEVEYLGNSIKLSLVPDRRYFREDWFVNLQRNAA